MRTKITKVVPAVIILFSLSLSLLFSQDKPVRSEEGTILIPAKDSADDRFYNKPADNREISPPRPEISVEEKSSGSKSASLKNAGDDSIPVIIPPEKADDPQVYAHSKARTYFDGYNTFVNSYVAFILSSRDNLIEDKAYCQIDSGEFAVYSAPFTLSAEGKRTISYYSVDKIGNRELKANEFQVIVDNTPPEISVASNMPTIGNRLYAVKGLALQAAAKDSSSGVDLIEYSIDGGPYQKYFSPVSPTAGEAHNLNQTIKFRSLDNLANQSESFIYKAIDLNGKISEVRSSEVILYFDRIPPTLKIIPQKKFIHKEGLNKNITVADNQYEITAEDSETGINAVYFRVDSQGDFIKYNGAIRFNRNGDHIIEAFAEDRAGNASRVSILNVFVDSKPPVSDIRIINAD